jgi:hypothetical protein
MGREIESGYRIGSTVPDDIFSYQKSQFGYICEGLGMEIVGILYGHIENLSHVV